MSLYVIRGLKTALYSIVALALTSCAPASNGAATSKYATNTISTAIVPATTPPVSTDQGNTTNTGLNDTNTTDVSTSSTASVNSAFKNRISQYLNLIQIAKSTAPLLEFQVEGVGNHAEHICVPAKTKLQLRMKPIVNYEPLLPVSMTPTYKNGKIVYDGLPAYYNQLRVRMTLVGSAAAWDYLSNLGTNSVIGDYSSYIKTIQGPQDTYHQYLNPIFFSPIQVPNVIIGNDPSQALSIPEYKDLWILGSDPNDGLCTYWEQQLGKCSNLSDSLVTSEKASCASGEVKVLINNIVSDYPCTNDIVGWCKGGSIQTVTDYQRWSIRVQAATENTIDF